MIVKKFSRKKSNRELLFRNQVTSLLLYERIATTKAKAKVTKALTESLISKAKSDTLSNKKYVYNYLCDKKAAKKLFNDILPRFSDRNSGYIRNLNLKERPGDGAEVQILEFIDYKPIVKPKVESEILETKTVEKTDAKRDKKLQKLSQDQVKDNVTTIVRKKGERRISNEK